VKEAEDVAGRGLRDFLNKAHSLIEKKIESQRTTRTYT
jgi:hypothetical protein